MENVKPKMGRPPKPSAEKLRGVTIKLNDEQRAKVALPGGMQWVRDMIDANHPPTIKPLKGG